MSCKERRSEETSTVAEIITRRSLLFVVDDNMMRLWAVLTMKAIRNGIAISSKGTRNDANKRMGTWLAGRLALLSKRDV